MPLDVAEIDYEDFSGPSSGPGAYYFTNILGIAWSPSDAPDIPDFTPTPVRGLRRNGANAFVTGNGGTNAHSIHRIAYLTQLSGFSFVWDAVFDFVGFDEGGNPNHLVLTILMGVPGPIASARYEFHLFTTGDWEMREYLPDVFPLVPYTRHLIGSVGGVVGQLGKFSIGREGNRIFGLVNDVQVVEMFSTYFVEGADMRTQLGFAANAANNGTYGYIGRLGTLRGPWDPVTPDLPGGGGTGAFAVGPDGLPLPGWLPSVRLRSPRQFAYYPDSGGDDR